MNVDIKKWNPWNWFRNEQEQEGRSLTVQPQEGQASGWLPSFYGDHPLWHLHRNIDRIFEGMVQNFGSLRDIGGSMLKPNVNIREGKKDYKITVEVPGVDEKDVKLELAEGALTIGGEKKHETEEKDENYYCIERSYGSFRRVLTLPSDIEQDEIEAKFKNGVLTITVPRKQMAKSKEEAKVIEIKRAS